MTAPGVPGDALTGVDAVLDRWRASMRRPVDDPGFSGGAVLAAIEAALVDVRAHLAATGGADVAERERAAAVEALREAADEIDATVGTEPVLMHVVDWVDGVEYAARRVRDRADRRAER